MKGCEKDVLVTIRSDHMQDDIFTTTPVCSVASLNSPEKTPASV